MLIERFLQDDERNVERRSQHSQQLAQQDCYQRDQLRAQLIHKPEGLVTLFCLGIGAATGLEYLRRSVGSSCLKTGARVLWRKLERKL